jgi:hypothetical protein
MHNQIPHSLLPEVLENMKHIQEEAERKAQRPVQLGELLTYLLMDAKKYADRAESGTYPERETSNFWMIAADERGWACELMLNSVKPAKIEWYQQD